MGKHLGRFKDENKWKHSNFEFIFIITMSLQNCIILIWQPKIAKHSKKKKIVS